MALRILINGSKGRMGQALASAAPDVGLQVVAALDAGDDLASAVPGCDVIVDFSSPAATANVLKVARAHRKAVVLGTTGHSESARKSLRLLAAKVPCVWAGNFSIGVNLLFALVDRAAGILGPDYD